MTSKAKVQQVIGVCVSNSSYMYGAKIGRRSVANRVGLPIGKLNFNKHHMWRGWRWGGGPLASWYSRGSRERGKGEDLDNTEL